MGEPSPNDPVCESELTLALQLMQQALSLLDAVQAPADIGAHLDLAIVRLNQLVSGRHPTI